MNESTSTIGGRTAAGRGVLSGINWPLCIVFGAIVLAVMLYWPTSVEIADFWQDTARRRYTHGWAVLAVTVWLIWRDRAYLRTIPLAPPICGWILVALVSLAWLVAANAGLLTVTILALPVLALTAIWAAGGLGLARRVAFPVLFLYFALPIWDAIDPPLQALTVTASLRLVQGIGIPATTDGYVIHIPEGWFEIASSCNGLHFLIVALAIGAVHGHVDRDRWWSRITLLALACGLAILTNVVRVVTVIVAGHLTDMQHFLVQINHYYFGWILFAIALVGYVLLSSRLPRSTSREPAAPLPVVAATPDPGLAAIRLAMAALALGPAWSLAQSSGDTPAAVQPPQIRGWAGPEPAHSDWKPNFDKADEEWQVEYHSDSRDAVSLYVAVYHRQRQGKELRGHESSVTGPNARVMASASRQVHAAGLNVPVTEQHFVSAEGRERLVWWLYAVDGQPSSMGLRDRLWYGVRALGNAPTVAVIAIAAECSPDCARAPATLEGLSVAAIPGLLSSLQR